MQKPSVGRIVHFFPTPHDAQARNNHAEVLPAIITQVGDEETGCVNLRVFQDGTNILWRTSVMPKAKAQKGEACWNWPAGAPSAGQSQATGVSQEELSNTVYTEVSKQLETAMESKLAEMMANAQALETSQDTAEKAEKASEAQSQDSKDETKASEETSKASGKAQANK